MFFSWLLRDAPKKLCFGGGIAEGDREAAGNRFTVQAFVKAESAPTASANVVGVGDGAEGYAWALTLDNSRQIVLKAKLVADNGTTNDYTQATGISVADGEWHQLALTCNALTRVFQLYHNGTLAATYSDWANPMLHNTSGGLTIGGGLGLESVAGKVDEVQFAHSILTAAQITQTCKEGFLVIIR